MKYGWVYWIIGDLAVICGKNWLGESSQKAVTPRLTTDETNITNNSNNQMTN